MGNEPGWIRDSLSLLRFAPYLARVDGDLDAAIQLYWRNVGVSTAFYAPLHCLEMALRNAVHRRLATWSTSSPTGGWLLLCVGSGG